MCLPSPFSARCPLREPPEVGTSRWTPCHDSRMALCIQPMFCSESTRHASVSLLLVSGEVALPGEFARDLDDARHERLHEAARRSRKARPRRVAPRRRMGVMSRSMSMGTTTPAPLCVIPYLPYDVQGRPALPNRPRRGRRHRAADSEFQHPLAERQRQRGLRLLCVDHRAFDRCRGHPRRDPTTGRGRPGGPSSPSYDSRPRSARRCCRRAR